MPERALPQPVPWPATPPDLNERVADDLNWHADPSRWLMRAYQPHRWKLPSGRAVVGVRDETEPWIWVELGDGVTAELDLSGLVDPDDDFGLVELLLHWWPSAEAAAYRLDGEATVRVDLGARAELTIVPAPPGAHSALCEYCGEDERGTQLRTWVTWPELAGYLDVMASLSRDLRFDPVPDAGVTVWRGRRDAHGRAVIERLTPKGEVVPGRGRFDGRVDDRIMAVVATVDLGLPAPLERRAVPVPDGVPSLRIHPAQVLVSVDRPGAPPVRP